MKLYIKNKFASFGGSSTVKDEMGNERYLVKGKSFSMRKKKNICDIDGNTLFIVRNKLFNLVLPTAFVCDANDNVIYTVKCKASFKNGGFTVEGNNEKITVLGSAFRAEKEICRNDKPIGKVSRDLNLTRDSFTLEIDDGEDPALMTALVIAIDNLQDKMSESHD